MSTASKVPPESPGRPSGRGRHRRSRCRGWRSWTPRARRARAAARRRSASSPSTSRAAPCSSKWTPDRHRDGLHAGPDPRAARAGEETRSLVLDGLDMKSAVGEQHQAGIIALADRHARRPRSQQRLRQGGPSIDQVIATRISAGKRQAEPRTWPCAGPPARSHGRVIPINVANFEDNATFDPSRRAWTRWRSARTCSARSTGRRDGARWRRESILDFVDRRYAALAARLGAADRQKLEQHLDQDARASSSGSAAPCRALRGAGPGRHVGLQPRERPELGRRRQRSTICRPTPPSPRSAS